MRETVWIELYDKRGELFRTIEVNAVVDECSIVTHEGRWYMHVNGTGGGSFNRLYQETEVFHARG